MSRLCLSLAYGPSLRVAGILDGTVGVEGVDIIPSRVHMSELAWRQLHRSGGGRGDFDISEFSLSSLLISHDRGERDFVAIPVFPMRKLFHTGILVRTDSTISEPADLVGKRVGIPEYQQTGALWIRQALTHEFDVEPSQMEWWMGRSKHLSHGGATGFTPPPGVTMHYVPDDDDLGSMLLRGDLDALLMYNRNTLVDRSTADLDADPTVRTLFADPVAEGIRYQRSTGILPINHALTIRRSLVEEHPWLAMNLFKAFSEAKRIGESQLMTDVQPYVAAGRMTVDALDAYPYGIAANRHVLDVLRTSSHEQGLTSRAIELDEIFVDSLLEV